MPSAGDTGTLLVTIWRVDGRVADRKWSLLQPSGCWIHLKAAGGESMESEVSSLFLMTCDRGLDLLLHQKPFTAFHSEVVTVTAILYQLEISRDR